MYSIKRKKILDVKLKKKKRYPSYIETSPEHTKRMNHLKQMMDYNGYFKGERATGCLTKDDNLKLHFLTLCQAFLFLEKRKLKPFSPSLTTTKPTPFLFLFEAP